jgi:NAD+ synthase (glutamine-hydrolysing)
MYNVNGGVPKTLVKEIVSYFGEIENLKDIDFKVNENKRDYNKFAEIIKDIVNTEVSPELLPNASDKISQKTEDIIGPYELIDFYIFYLLRYGFTPSKILFYAEIAFEGLYTQIELKKWLKVFIYRFFSNQYKRNLMPDSVKIGSIALSPRGDWRMPSELDFQIWIDDLEDN